MLLYVIRHGDPIYDPDSLTEKGKRQAEALARRLAVNGLDRIYSSPLNRARQTAQPTCEILKKEPVILDWTSEALAWNEFAFHDPEIGGYMTWSFARADRFKTAEILSMGDGWMDMYPFSETKMREGRARIARESDAFLESLGYKHEGMSYKILQPNHERIAVFCHWGFGTTWLSHMLDIHPLLFWSTFDLNHSSITIIHFHNDKSGICNPKCLALSDTSHFYGDRLPLEFTNGIRI
ncbi:MAG: histidine phosphatase family protein [Clostridia bacterium]|nr:histidine phosphatase family protein [Clostridia bacterium]